MVSLFVDSHPIFRIILEYLRKLRSSSGYELQHNNTVNKTLFEQGISHAKFLNSCCYLLSTFNVGIIATCGE